jgi:Multicopper oxidase
MRRNIKTPAFVAALLGLTAVGATSLVNAADGVTIADRMGDINAMVVGAGDPDPYVQELANTCDASCELFAREAVINVPGLGNVMIWGFTQTSDPDVLPTLPGPTIVVESGEPVTISVTNEMSAAVGDFGLDFRGIPVADRVASPTMIAVGDTVTYEFTTDQVGTSVYAASAVNPNGNRQLAMGLAGALVVRPIECPDAVAGCAYGDPATVGNAGSIGYDAGTDVFDEEALIAMNDIDLDFHADPLGYDMTNYQPTAHLINGKVYPETDVIDTRPGHNVLLRYVNLGLVDHSMGLVGKHQRIIGRDASALAHGSDDVTIPLNVGQTVDAMVTVPLDALAGHRYPLADQARRPGATTAEGAMTFLTVFGDEPVEGLPFGHIWDINLVGGDSGSGSETDGYADLAFGGDITGTPTYGRFSIDDPGTVLPSSLAFGTITFPTTTSFAGLIPVAELATLANGNHTLWVEFSANGADWGNPSGISFTIDRAGPVVTPVEADVLYTDGLVDVAITATADATLTGTGEVTGGTASIDTCPDFGTQPVGIDLTPNGPGLLGEGPIVELSGVITAAEVDDLTDGAHTINVAAVDSRGRWSNTGDPDGAAVSVCGEGTIIVDRTVPATTAVTVTPNPNDGTQAFPGIESYLDVVRITATVTDPVVSGDPSGVGAVEGFIDDGLLPMPIDDTCNTPVPPQRLSCGNWGTGFMFMPADGLFDEAVEEVYADVPLASIASMTPGDHALWVHGQDKAGNWEPFVEVGNTNITVVAGAPLVAAYTLLPTELPGDPLTSELAVTAGAYGVGNTIDGFEYSIGVGPLAPGAGTAVSVDPASVVSTVIGPLALGPNTNVWVRAHDSLGNWSPAVGLPTAGAPAVGPSLNNSGTPSGSAANRRRRLSGIASATVGTIARVEYSIGASPAAPGSGITITSVTAAGAYSVTRAQTDNLSNANHRFQIGDVVWVRVLDSQGNWGPAASVTVVGP